MHIEKIEIHSPCSRWQCYGPSDLVHICHTSLQQYWEGRHSVHWRDRSYCQNVNTHRLHERQKKKSRGKVIPLCGTWRADPKGVRIILLLYRELSVICGHDGAEKVGKTLRNQNQQQWNTAVNCGWSGFNKNRMGKIKTPTAETSDMVYSCDITAGVLLYNFWAHAVSSKKAPEGL